MEKINFTDVEWKTRRKLLTNPKIKMWFSTLQLIKMQEDFVEVPNLSSFLETEVDEKYYLSAEQQCKIVQKINGYEDKDKIIVNGYLNSDKWKKFNESSRRVYDPKGVAPCIPTSSGGGHLPKIKVMCNVNPSGNGMNGQVYSSEDISPTISTNKGEGTKIAIDVYNKKLRPVVPTLTDPTHNSIRIAEDTRIRKLTPTETESLQGFQKGWTDIVMTNGKRMSDTQRYKMMGNAMSVPVVGAVIERIMELENDN